MSTRPFEDDIESPLDVVGVHHVSRGPLAFTLMRHRPVFDVVLDDATEAAARRAWDEENAARVAAQRPPMTPSPLYRPSAARPQGDWLIVEAGLTDYRANRALAAPLSEWDAGRALGAGLSIIPVAADGAILVGRRSGVVADGVGAWHVCGGHAHPGDSFRRGDATIVSWVLEELAEEMRIGEDDLDDLEYLGMVWDRTSGKPELIARAALREPSAVYRARWQAAPTEEFDRLDVVGGAVGAWRDERLVVAARGALLVHELTERRRPS